MLQVPPVVLSRPDAALGCLVLAGSFVASLYLSPTRLSRNHPQVIRQRIKAVACISIAAPAVPVVLLHARGALSSLQAGLHKTELQWS